MASLAARTRTAFASCAQQEHTARACGRAQPRPGVQVSASIHRAHAAVVDEQVRSVKVVVDPDRFSRLGRRDRSDGVPDAGDGRPDWRVPPCQRPAAKGGVRTGSRSAHLPGSMRHIAASNPARSVASNLMSPTDAMAALFPGSQRQTLQVEGRSAAGDPCARGCGTGSGSRGASTGSHRRPLAWKRLFRNESGVDGAGSGCPRCLR